MKRRDIRELVMKALFASEIEDGDPFRQLEYIADDGEMSGSNGEETEFLLSDGTKAYVRRFISGVLSHKEELDERIIRFSPDWELARLGGAERNVLRMSLYEMLYDEKLPPAIAINEAVDLVKKYGSTESAKYVNAVLDKNAAELK